MLLQHTELLEASPSRDAQNLTLVVGQQYSCLLEG